MEGWKGVIAYFFYKSMKLPKCLKLTALNKPTYKQHTYSHRSQAIPSLQFSSSRFGSFYLVQSVVFVGTLFNINSQ